jgi:ankyrin repeat protein
MTPLMWACYFNLSEIVELLVKKNANLNCQTVLYEWTALMHGSYTNSAESVKILLENNANINIIDSEGKKAIDIAKREGHEEIIELLKIHDNLNH